MQRSITAALLFAAALPAHAQVIEWTNPAGGVWTDPMNWSTQTVPTLLGQTASIATPGSYTVTLNANLGGLGGLSITNPSAVLSLSAGRRFGVRTALHNDALILLDDAGEGTTLEIRANTALTGSGLVRLNGPLATLTAQPGLAVTNGPDHTVVGWGVIDADIVNDGLVLADTPAHVLHVVGDWSGSGILGATDGGVLQLDPGTTLTGSPVVTLLGDGGRVAISGAALANATLDSTGEPWQLSAGATLGEGVTLAGSGLIPASQTVHATSDLTNNAQLFLSPPTGTPIVRTTLAFDNKATLAGTGSTVLGGNYTRVTAPFLTIAEDHLVTGSGRVEGDGLLLGRVLALTPTDNVLIGLGDWTIEGTLAAHAGVAGFTNGVLTLPPGVELLADGGTVSLASATVHGGLLRATPGSHWSISTATLYDTAIEGDGTVAGTLTFFADPVFTGSTIGVTGVVQAGANNTLAGDVRIVLQGGRVSSRTADGTTSLTIAPGVIVSGMGEVNNRVTNRGTILANDPAGDISFHSSLFTNEGVVRSDGGDIELRTTVFAQTDNAVLDAVNGSINLGGSVVTGGRITSHGGLVKLTGTLRNLTIDADAQITSSNSMTVDTTFTNDGDIHVGPWNLSGNHPRIVVNAPATIDGHGTITLERGQITGDATLTIGANQTVRGRGDITAPLLIQGALMADDASGQSSITAPTVENRGDLGARAGAVLLIDQTALTQTGDGRLIADAGRVVLRGGTLQGGRIETPQNGVVQATAGAVASGIDVAGTLVATGDPGLRLAGDVHLDGLLQANDQTVATFSTIRVDTPVAITGNGVLALINTPGAGSMLGQAVTVAEGVTITGSGSVYCPLTMSGRLEPGQPVGTLLLQNETTLTPVAHYRCEVASEDAHDAILARTIHLAGTLELVPVDGFAPQGAWSVPVITAQLSHNGAFDQVTGPPLDDDRLIYRAVNAGDEVRAGAYCIADLDSSGSLNFFDVNTFLLLFNIHDPAADFSAPFGSFDFFDVSAYLALYSAGCP